MIMFLFIVIRKLTCVNLVIFVKRRRTIGEIVTAKKRHFRGYSVFMHVDMCHYYYLLTRDLILVQNISI